jgi:amidase
MQDITFAPATRLAALIRTRKLGCLEAVDHYIARIERLDHELNAVVVRDFDRARKRARALDRKGEISGKLHGVPMTLKESFDVAGLPTSWGFPEFRDHIAAEDALAVQRLTDAGAVVLGKTNVPKALMDWQSYNAVYGTTRNPWNPGHTPGGSSGGAAAALAAGFCALEAGSDIGGSIRVPAHFCGVYGHKPTWGLCPPYGHSLRGAASMTDISVIGPLARSAEDLAIALEVMAGPDPAETPLTYRLPLPRIEGLPGLRVAVWASDPATETDAATTDLLLSLARFLRRAGCKISTTARPEFDATAAYRLYIRLLATATSGRQSEAERAAQREAAAKLAPDDMGADAITVRCVDMPHHEWLALHEERARLQRVWGAFFRNWDVLICPVMSTPALPIMEQGETWERRIEVNGASVAYSEQLFWPGLIGGFHLPATAVPLGMNGTGLPIGMQIVGPLFGDRTTIAVARLLERAWRDFTPPERFAV